MKILVTGGAGFIGTHVSCELLTHGHDVVVVDDLSNSYAEQMETVARVAGKAALLHVLSVSDTLALTELLRREKPDAVIHCAGLKSVPESMADPMLYYRENLKAAVSLIEAMNGAGCHRLVFSSSAAVYGQPETLPLTEDHPLRPASPYGWTKLIIEQMLRDLCRADDRWRVIALRYFNPAGAHPSGEFGERAKAENPSLLAAIAGAAADSSRVFEVFGGDYATADGSAVRDLIHIADLAGAHLAAVEGLGKISGMEVFNVGTGTGCTVLEVLREFEKAAGFSIRHKISPARPGDVAISYASPARARELLGWRTKRTLPDICRDGWTWQQKSSKAKLG